MFAIIKQIDGIPVVYQRPDSVHILYEEEFKLRLPRYYRLLKRETVAKFLVAKMVEVEFDENDNLDELWEIHNEGIKRERELLENEENIVNRYIKGDYPKINLLKLKSVISNKIIENCSLCEWRCGINRKEKKVGVCRLDDQTYISSVFIHIGEEAELVPSYTIFFSHCNFKCVFCQNWDISQHHSGRIIPPEILAEAIDKEWHNRRIRNINWVGGEPTPNLHYILRVLNLVRESVPVVWNSNFYDSIETMQLLNGIVDVWLPDFKYGNSECALKYSKIPNYFETVTRNFKMLSEWGEEILIRHLIMPNHVECCTKPILKWLKENMDLSHTRLNLMDQYRPEYKAHNFPEISRRISESEWNEAFKFAKSLGISLTL